MPDGNYRAQFGLGIKNDGSRLLKAGEGYWHAYKIHVNNPYTVPGNKGHQRGLIEAPVFPNSFVDLPVHYDLIIKKEEAEGLTIPYFFSTSYGNFPRTVRIEHETSYAVFERMGHIKFELPE